MGRKRKNYSLFQDLIISRVRVKILELFFNNLKEMFHIREIVRLIDEEINSVRRELSHLERKGVLKKEERGNRLYYSLREDYTLYNELLNIVTKTSGIGRSFLENKSRMGRLKFVMLNGRFVKREPRGSDEVDILIVGDVVLPEVVNLIKEAEKKLQREITYTVMTVEEFAFRKKGSDPFLRNILWNSRVMVIGKEEDLIK